VGGLGKYGVRETSGKSLAECFRSCSRVCVSVVVESSDAVYSSGECVAGAVLSHLMHVIAGTRLQGPLVSSLHSTGLHGKDSASFRGTCVFGDQGSLSCCRRPSAME
jgi:hypothetical protein